MPGPVGRSERGWASWGGAVVTRGRATARRRASSEGRSARAPARRCGPAGSAQRAAPPSRWVGAALVGRRAGRGDGLGGWWPGARSAPRWSARGLRRRRRARVARLSAGEPEAGGSRPPRPRTALVWASLVAFVALPPWRAGLERACPRTQGRPWAAPSAARQDQGNRPAAARPLGAREGAMAVRSASGVAAL
jgi:hypothetical protein